jgi:hypothetical protein
MNIFYLHNDQRKCAEMHVDKHCVKMILEYAQLLSTAHRILDGVPTVVLSDSGRKKTVYRLSDHRDSILYSATHANHPSAIWARGGVQNYMWLAEMLECLCSEYTYRYEKVHKVEATGLMQTLKNNFPNNIPEKSFTEPTPAMPEDYKVPGNSIQSYKNYYNGEKSRMFKWKKRPTPEWITYESQAA